MYEPVWHRPTTRDEALSRLRDAGEAARVIAGGTDLAASIVAGVERPAVLIDLSRVDGLRGPRTDQSITAYLGAAGMSAKTSTRELVASLRK